MDEYNEIEMDPIDVLFEKIHSARKGEFLMIHVTEYGKDGPSVKVCSAIDKRDSIMLEILPSIIKKFVDDE
jgi:hypothetical protein